LYLFEALNLIVAVGRSKTKKLCGGAIIIGTIIISSIIIIMVVVDLV
jgi:hypothetical protein